jgi:hypothetical protein
MQNNITPTETDNIFRILGIIMTCCSAFVVAFFLTKNAPLIIKKSWNSDSNFNFNFNSNLLLQKYQKLQKTRKNKS